MSARLCVAEPGHLPVPILMYHAVTDAPAPAARRLSVTPAAFAGQLDLLASAGFTPVTAGRLASAWREGRPLPPRPAVITFDDGYDGVHRHALPALKGHGFEATLFVSTGWLRGRPAADLARGAPDTMLDWHQVRGLAAAGLEIGAHSHSHPQLDQLGDERLRFEVTRCREILREELGSVLDSFAYPYGYSSRRVRRAVREAGYTVAFAVGNTHADRAQGPYALRRITVRRATGIEEFERLVEGRRLSRVVAKDRAMTKGYAVVRRTRRALRKVREAGA